MPLPAGCFNDLVNSQRGSTKNSLKIIMDLGEREGAEIPMAISSNFFPVHEGGAPKLKLLTGSANGGSNSLPVEEFRQNSDVKVKKAVKYRECQKNHAANLGSYAFDGCGEFMPSGEEGTLEALKCAACECHRNFHRREVEGEPSCDCRQDRKRLLPSIMTPQTPLPLPPGAMLPRPPSQMIMALNTLPSESDDQEGGFLSPLMAKKRFRTKFTFEQKEKMLSFAEKVGWRLRKHDDPAVQQFCSDVGVKRQVLKVWMHNNKNSLGKKLEEDFVLAPDATNVDEENTS